MVNSPLRLRVHLRRHLAIDEYHGDFASFNKNQFWSKGCLPGVSCVPEGGA